MFLFLWNWLDDIRRSNLSQCNAQTFVRRFYNVLCTRKSDVRFSKVVRWITAVYVCVLRPWDYCLTCYCILATLHYHCTTYQPQWLYKIRWFQNHIFLHRRLRFLWNEMSENFWRRIHSSGDTNITWLSRPMRYL